MTAVLALLASLLLVSMPGAEAAASLTLDKSAPTQSLAGGPVTFELVVRNPRGGEQEYNLSFRDELPAGIRYVPGSAAPAFFGEPTVLTAPEGHQILLWPNVVDLPPGGEQEVSFAATPDPAVHPVGSVVQNTASVYANTDARRVPRFDGSGALVPDTATEQATSNTTSTTMSPLEVTKDEPSPEHELVRGVHEQSTVYTLRVSTAETAGTEDVVVVDHLPAGLEFLGCGTQDNSAAPEYPGAPSLSSVPDVTPCSLPVSVETVQDPAGVPAGVYTRVTWRLGTMAAGSDQVIRYRAGIPQRANTMTFPGGTPAPAGLGQQANLDNNTGPSTRESASEAALTNHVRVTGRYTGPVAADTSTAVAARTSTTVSVEDLALHKSVSPGSFAAGRIATYTLTVRTGEYASATGVVVEDVLPDGLCPLSSTRNHHPENDSACAPVTGGGPTGADYDSVQRNPDGSWTIRFTPVDVAPNSIATITFPARMQASYASGTPTVSGDEFVNTASLTGTTHTRSEVNSPESGSREVSDTTEAVLTSDAPSLTKLIQPQTGATPYECSTTAAGYTDTVSADDPGLTFATGDRVCFLIRVTTSEPNMTRNAKVTDFLPLGMTYEPGSATPTPASTVPSELVQQSPLVWRLSPSGGGRSDFVDAGGIFEVRFSAIVDDPAPGPAPDLTGNLAKLQWENTADQVTALRDEANFSVAATPVSIAKSADRTAPSSPAPLPHGSTIDGGATVQYTVGVTNEGTAAARNDDPVLRPEVWDALPVGLSCADVVAGSISDGGRCLAPGASGYPQVGGPAGRSVIVWERPPGVEIAAGATHEFTYRVLLPDSLSVSNPLENTARLAGFHTRTNTGALEHHEVDESATHRLTTAAVTVDKNVTTAITETNNNAATEATNGEGVTYTYSVRVPAHSSVHDGVLTDALPTGVTRTGDATVRYVPDAGTGTTAPLPAGFTLDAATGALTFPASWTNATGADQLFTVTLPARVTATAAHNSPQTNTATFRSNLTPGGAALAPRSDSARVTVQRPAPTLAKSSEPVSRVTAGQDVTYTLRASTAGARPPLHDAFVVDCLPAGLTYVPGSATPAPHSGPVAGTGTGAGDNGCAVGTSRLEWSLGSLQPGASVPVTYTASVPTGAGGGLAYTNTARLTGSTLNDGKLNATDPNNPHEAAATATASRTVTLPPAATVKTAQRPTYTVGERTQWTVTVRVPANVNYYDAAVTDLLPAGLSASADEPRLESAECTTEGGSACPMPGGAPTRLANTATAGGTLVAWGLGDILAAPQDRTITLVYSTPVADVPSVQAGGGLANVATLRWNNVDGTMPPTAGGPWTHRTDPATARVTVTEPRLTPAKSVDRDAPQPGETFHYTVGVTNASTHASDAHNVVVTDTVPDGVVVDAAGITGGGALTGQTSTGGGTITWTITGPVAPGASLSFGYQARLADPAPAAPLTNTVRITGYESLPTGGRAYTGGSASETVGPSLPHVRMEKTVIGDGQARVGEPTTWQLRVTSDGTATAHGVDAVDLLPPNWRFVDGSEVVLLNGSPVTAAPTVTGSSRQTLSWTDVGSLAPGQSLVITYRAVPQQAATTEPGSGSSVEHVNTATPGAEDALGRSGSTDAPYAGPADTAAARIHRADLVLDKSHTADPIAGGPVSWTVAVRNTGPDAAQGPWTVTDTVPAGLTGATASGAGWACSTVDSTITCTRPAGPDLAVGASLPPITVSAQVPAGIAEGTVLTNQATVTGRTFEADTDNNTDNDPVTVGTRADLALAKDFPGPLVAGSEATWTVDLRNLGPSVSRAPIEVTDTLPTGVLFTAASGTGWTCTPGTAGPTGQQVRCTLSQDVGSGQPAPQLSISASVPADRSTAVVNSAAITDTVTTDPQPGNDTDTVSTRPATSADLQIAKTRTTPIVAGESGTYRFTVANHGPSDAQSVVVRDRLPAGLTLGGSQSVDGNWSCSATGQQVTCTLTGALAAGAAAVVEIDVEVDPAHTGAVLNTATVASDTPDPVPGNNEDDDDTSTDVRADLTLAKSSTGTAVAGEPLSWTLQARNLGPSVSPGPVVVRDAMPAGVTATAASGAGWTCQVQDEFVECTHPGPLGLGEAPAITIDTQLAPDVPVGPLTNTGTVDGPADERPTNDAGQHTVTVAHEADVYLTKTAPDTPAVAGQELEFVVQVGNRGPSQASAVVVQDVLPAGMTAVALSGDGWECDVQTLTCTLAQLAPDSAQPLTVRARIDSGVPAGTVLTNTARVSTSTSGDDPADNTGDADVQVSARTDLAITKSHEDEAVAGTELVFTVEVGNNGPSDAVAPVVFTDTLPDGMAFLAADGGDWVCTPGQSDAQQVECSSAAAVAAGTAAAPLQITVMLSPQASGELTNVVELAERQDEVDSDRARADNRDSDEVAVTRVADLSVDKSHSGDASIGEELTFDIEVANAGPSAAGEVVVTDTLPSGLTFVSGAGEGWTCTAEDDRVRCELAEALPVGEQAPPLAITTLVDEAAFPDVRNTVTVDSSSHDPQTEDNTATDPVQVQALVNLSLTKTHTGDAVVGGRSAWTLTVTNSGPTPAISPVQVVDPLPAGLSFVSGGGQGWDCSATLQLTAQPATELVTCVRQDGLEVGSSTITLVTRVDPAAHPSVTNTARVTGADAETTLTDNAASATATVTRAAEVDDDRSPGTGPGTGPGTAPGQGTGPGPGSGQAQGSLPRTGMELAQFLGAALVMIAVGARLAGRARPRRT